MQITKSQLAKLLATEDITVRHSFEATTASFDVRNRVLTLPEWSTDDTNTLDMMIGHEVGHALYTLEKEWESAIDAGYHKGILNVIEDARIEKRIKRKFPGLTRSFLSGYRLLMDRNFFGNLNEVEQLPLIDRLNLHFKLGYGLNIPFFNSIEDEYVTRIEECETWADVLAITTDLMNHSMEEMKEDDFHMGMIPSDESFDGDSDDSDEFDGFDGNGEDFENRENSHSEDLTNLPEDLVSTQEAFDRAVQENLTKTNNHASNDIIYYTLPEPNLNRIVVSPREIGNLIDKCIADGQRRDTMEYHNLSDEIVADVTANYSDFRRRSTKIVNYMAKEFERKKSAAAYSKEYENKTGQLNVNKLYSYRYNEDLFLRNTIRPDGKNHGVLMLLDWSASMHENMLSTMQQTLNLAWFCRKVNIPFEVYAFTNQYYSDDTLSEDTWIRQQIRKNSVKVRAMSEKESKAYLEDLRTQWQEKGIVNKPYWNSVPGNVMFDGGEMDSFHLLNLISSRMNAKQFNDAARNCYLLGNNLFSYRHPLGLGSTPSLDALVCMNKIIPAFQKRYGLDKTSLMILTDGEGNSGFSHVNDPSIENGKKYLRSSWAIERLEDRETKRIYSTEKLRNGQSSRRGVYMHHPSWQEVNVRNLLAEKYDTRIIGIFLESGRNKSVSSSTLSRFIGPKFANMERHKELRTQVRKTGVASLPFPGYDEFHIVPVAKMVDVEDNALEGITEDMTTGKIKRLFAKSQDNKTGNKILVNKIMEVIA